MERAIRGCAECPVHQLCRSAGISLKGSAEVMRLVKVLDPERNLPLFVDALRQVGVERPPMEVLRAARILDGHRHLCPKFG